ncbi:MAG: DUF885 family protein [Armatimonadetes bacterium]|nr:DUF885 family protein [Armatimonadota bacterium]
MISALLFAVGTTGGDLAAPIKAMSNELTQLTALENAMIPIVERFSMDRDEFERLYLTTHSADRFAELKVFLAEQMDSLGTVDFDDLGVEGRVDWLLLRNRIEYELLDADIDLERLNEASPLLPFLDMIVGFMERLRAMENVDSRSVAGQLADALEKLKSAKEDEIEISPFVALRAGRIANDLKRSLKTWFEFYDGYDPDFSWWVRKPYEEFDNELEAWIKYVNEELGGVKEDDDEAIVGDPVGREALLVDLKKEMIPYTPEELVRLADKELAWCKAELKKAATELGFDDPMAAMEYVKTLHVDPGDQPALIRDLALEAIAYLEDNDLMTIPELAKQSWQMSMMSPQRQLLAPFFLGGRTIIVSYPTDAMTHEQKLMSMRGNNEHFARATVHHELIPGHHMQQYMNRRFNTHRSAFGTPFWTEGWALYWEILLWDLGFPKTPENKIGMLFWRTHRAARIKFSLGFHLGQMTIEECVELLVNVVGHEQKTAEAEVRRSFEGSYMPLYQAAYLLGGLQINSLRNDLVENGPLSYKEFHDRIIRLNRMPIEMLRAILTDTLLEKEFETNWRFYGSP